MNVILVHLRTGLTHEALGVIYQAGSSTIGRAIGEIRPRLAERGFAVPQRPGLRLRTLAGVFACAEAENVTVTAAARRLSRVEAFRRARCGDGDRQRRSWSGA
ncbi:MAG: hypothetical protein QOE71_2363 [Pseudonocardiales bacterium]|nr:hypothetical protein [Pseudonocardiales bacterium]